MLRSSIKKICFLGLSSFAITTTPTYAQDFYKWVDASGSTHYTTTPPPKERGVNGKGKIKTYNSRVEQINTNRVSPTTTSVGSESLQSNTSIPVQPQPSTQNLEPESKQISLAPANIQPAPVPPSVKLPTTSGSDQDFSEIRK